ncbi:RagB/SusD family nutrient uptake outer membrane protein [Chitinophaga sp. G-6-1-13]|uniref:RagB/SusD family nutrient uptake outer membrane protein n=1 Tax=Chitinophaga fulva TaxID=2728842 RepID=A0A848GHU3_9BACT|nr:RagB/SusD family nutrient uptake outer membrane protein [Chitinophaga fulva]NML36632.1 RagB/SusD family nutrient uptake outer membrane protein [Chitinophaga fulva]
MKKIFLFILAGIIFTGSACKKSFFDRYPQDAIAPPLFFKSEEDLSLYINGLLSITGTDIYYNDQSSDNMATTAQKEIKNMMTGSPTSRNISDGWDWDRLRNINYFLDNYNKAQVTQEVKDHYAGLARYYRALFYFGMVKRYSDVPWYGKSLDPNDSAFLYKARDPRALVVDSIIADLSFAAAHIRTKVTSGTPNVWAAKAAFARIALHEGTYRKYHPELNLQGSAGRFLDTAIHVSEDIMKNGGFGVYDVTHTPQDYTALFNSADLLQNKEVILAHPYDAAKSASSGGTGTVFGDYEQSPSRDLIQSYLMADGSRFTDQAGYQQMQFVQEFVNRDPRLKETFAWPGFVKAGDNRPYIQRLNKNFSGYHQIKGYTNTTDNIAAGSVDVPAYRFAETLLIFAEAKAEQEVLTQADLDRSVNLLRTRVQMPAMNLAAANALPDPLLANQFTDVKGNMKGVILEIRRERRVELALEGFRYDDLMRWHGGKLLTKQPEGMYFPGLGKYDLTGDGIPDIILISQNTDIPTDDKKEKNALGINLIYYKAGSFGDNVTVYMKNGTAGGALVTEVTSRTFPEPQFYYRPIPFAQTVLNPNLKQIFDWQ